MHETSNPFSCIKNFLLKATSYLSKNIGRCVGGQPARDSKPTKNTKGRRRSSGQGDSEKVLANKYIEKDVSLKLRSHYCIIR